jgi:hypothetical protein
VTLFGEESEDVIKQDSKSFSGIVAVNVPRPGEQRLGANPCTESLEVCLVDADAVRQSVAFYILCLWSSLSAALSHCSSRLPEPWEKASNALDAGLAWRFPREPLVLQIDSL